MDTLLLNADYRPADVLNWKDAISLMMRDTSRLVLPYEDWVVRSPSVSINVPAVLVLQRYVKTHRQVRFSRTNIYIRDDFTCQYCGKSVERDELRVSDLSFDHVVPSSRGGKTTWENIITSCKPCNKRKADRLPKEADMPLLSKPYLPQHINNVLEYRLRGRKVPSEWRDFLADDAKVKYA